MRIFQPTVTGSNTTTGSLHISGPVYFYTLETSSVSHTLVYNTSSGQIFYTASTAVGRRPGEPNQSIQFNSGGEFSGSANFTFNNNIIYLTGSMLVSGAISASLGPNTVGFYGTASWAQNSLTASFITASNVWGPFGSSSVASASYASGSTSASYALTASFALNGGGGTPGGPNLSVQFNSASVFSGSGTIYITNADGPSSVEYDHLRLDNAWLTIRDSSNNITFTSDGLALGDSNGFNSLEWGSRVLYDLAGTQSIQYGTRQLIYPHNPSLPPLIAIDWGTANQVTISGSIYTPNLTNVSQVNAVVIDTASGQLYYLPTSSFGGGSGTPTPPAPPTNSIQFNSASAFGGSANFSFDYTNNIVYLTGSSITTGSATLTGSMFVSGAISASLGPNTIGFYGTSSWAISAITSSYPIDVTGSSLYSVAPAAGIPNMPETNNSIFFGQEAGLQTDSASNSNFLGYRAGNSANTASNSNFLGREAGSLSDFVTQSNFLGNQAGYQADNAYNSNFLGYRAGRLVRDAYNSNFIGYEAGSQQSSNNTSSYNSNFIGYQVGKNTNNIYNSNFIGYNAGTNADFSPYSNFLGYQAGNGSISASYSNFIGYNAGFNSDLSSHSIFIGYEAGSSAPTSSNSTFIGYRAGYTAQNSNNSIFIGYEAGREVLNSSHSIFIGYQAGKELDTGGVDYVGPNNIIIGTNVTLPISSQDSINIGGLIFATGSNSNTTPLTPTFTPAGGNVGINIYPPLYNFHASGTIAFPSLTPSSQVNIVVIDTASGQLFYTASNAIGGGGSGTPAPSDTYIQYNQGNAFGAEKDFRYIYDSHSLQQGNGVTAPGFWSHAQGSGSIASGEYSHAEGGAKFIFWEFTEAIGTGSHAEGAGTVAFGDGSHAEGRNTYTFGDYSHAEGVGTYTSRSYAHAEGFFTSASGFASHAEGSFTKTIENYSHAEGFYTIASGDYSHAEGSGSITLGIASHAEGEDTVAEGDYSHAEGKNTYALGNHSHAGGFNTTSSGIYQTVVGQNNISLTSQSAFIVGGGLTSVNKSNAFVVIPQTVLNDSVLEILVNTASINTSYLYLNNLPTQPQTHLLVYNTASGQVYYTASSAVGGGGGAFNSTSSVIGDGVNTTYTITHGFNTKNLHITVYETSSNGETVYPDIRRNGLNTAQIIFANPPGSASYVVYISQ